MKNAVLASFLGLALSAFAVQAQASLLITSNNFQANGSAGGWVYGKDSKGKDTSKIVSGMGADNKVLQFTGNADKALKHTFGKQDGDLLVSFDFMYTGVMSVNSFMGVSFGGEVGSPSIGIKSNCDDKTGKCKNDVFVRMSDSKTVMMDGSDLAANTRYTIFGRLYKDQDSATYNRFDAWLNPTADEMQSLTGWNASATAKTGIASVDKLGIRTAFLDTNSSLMIDNLQVSEVPEPATLSLVGLAMAGLAFGRRKRT